MGVLVQGGGGGDRRDFRPADRLAGSPAGLSAVFSAQKKGEGGRRIKHDFRPSSRPAESPPSR